MSQRQPFELPMGVSTRIGAIKSLQQFAITLTSVATQSYTCAPPVNPKQAILIYHGSVEDWPGAADPSGQRARIALAADGASVVATRTDTSADTTNVYGLLVEFRPGIIQSIEYGTKKPSGSAEDSVTLTTPVNPARASVFCLGCSQVGLTTIYPVYARLSTDGVTVKVRGSVNTTIGYLVVQWR